MAATDRSTSFIRGSRLVLNRQSLRGLIELWAGVVNLFPCLQSLGSVKFSHYPGPAFLDHRDGLMLLQRAQSHL